MEKQYRPSESAVVHVPCVGCGYDLFGSSGGIRCPECGRHCGESFDLRRLCFVEPARLRALSRCTYLWIILLCFHASCIALDFITEWQISVFFADWTYVGEVFVVPVLVAYWYSPIVTTIVERVVVCGVFIIVCLGIGLGLLLWVSESDPMYSALSGVSAALSFAGMHFLLGSIQKRAPSLFGAWLSYAAALAVIFLTVLILVQGPLGQIPLPPAVFYRTFVVAISTQCMLFLCSGLGACWSIRNAIQIATRRSNESVR